MGNANGDYITFIKACEDGNLGEFKKYLHNVNIHAFDEKAFRTACEHGSLEVVRTLLSYNVYVHVCEEAFRNACKNGHVEVVKLLFNHYRSLKDTINIHINDDEAFRSACINGHVDVVKLLLSCSSGFGFNINFNNDETFLFSCKRGHLEIVKILLQLNVNTATFNYAFRFACENNHVEIAKLLLDIGSDKIHINLLDIFGTVGDICSNGYTEILKLLISNKIKISIYRVIFAQRYTLEIKKILVDALDIDQKIRLANFNDERLDINHNIKNIENIVKNMIQLYDNLVLIKILNINPTIINKIDIQKYNELKKYSKIIFNIEQRVPIFIVIKEFLGIPEIRS